MQILEGFVQTGVRGAVKASATEMFETVASGLRKLTTSGTQDRDKFDSLSKALFRLGPIKKSEPAAVNGPMTLPELRDAESRLGKAIVMWNEQRLLQNCKEYNSLTAIYFRVASMAAMWL